VRPAVQARFVSVDEYLDIEAKNQVRHEYVAGTIFAMADAHNIIAGNFYMALRKHLRGGPCRVFFADFKARLTVAEDEIFYYPDVMVTCDPRDSGPIFSRFPKVVIEVLSETTERQDRTEKFWNYTQIETLQEYVLADQFRMQVSVFRRKDNWKPTIFSDPKKPLILASLNFKKPLKDFYEDVKFPEPAEQRRISPKPSA
jgi:Uma2 family endonuclease